MTDNSDSLYAKALVSLAEASGQLVRIEREMLEVLELFKSSHELRNFLGDLAIAPRGKTVAMEELLGNRTHPVVTHFVLLLHAQGLLRQIEEIARQFFKLASERRARASGLLISTRPVSDSLRTRIEAEIGRILEKEVHLLVQEDASLLGGMRVQVGDFVIDGTVDRQLEALRHQLGN